MFSFCIILSERRNFFKGLLTKKTPLSDCKLFLAQRIHLDLLNQLKQFLSLWEGTHLFNRIDLLFTSQPGPGATQEKFNAFFVKQSFFSSDLLGVGSTPGSGGWVGFPELVWRSIQNLAEIGQAVRALKRDTGTYIGRYKKSLLNI